MSTFDQLVFYRGFGLQYDVSEPSEHVTRKDRRPRDINPRVHELADSWFKKKFGVLYRSQSVFVTSDFNVALAYAVSPQHVARVIPIGFYSFCWSTQLRDMMELFIGGGSGDVYRDLDDSGYIEHNLIGAHRSGHEVMLCCDSYRSLPL